MSAGILAAAMALDAIVGEPRWIWARVPHPAVLMGRFIGWVDIRFNNAPGQHVRGVVLVIVLLLGAGALSGLVAALPFSGIFELLIVAVLLAQKSLAQHLRSVALALSATLGEGRHAVAQIVGRDTADMDEPAVARAAIESAAENFSDGVVAPALFYLVFGLPGIIAYKAINTADSMIGYKSTRYLQFGWAAARLDDLFNLIPARATAAGFSALSGQLRRWPGIRRDARLHRSPNAGWPEAAMARALEVSLSGPRSYDGETKDFPFVNSRGLRDAGPSDIRNAHAWLWRGWFALFAIVLACAALAW